MGVALFLTTRTQRMNKLDTKSWLILKTLYEEKNITKAAEKLFISQPALSYRIKQLEEELDVTILLRSRRGVTFTTEGEHLVQYSLKMLNELQNVRDLLRGMNNSEKGTIRLGVATNFARHSLPVILGEFSNQYHNIQYNLYTGITKKIIQMIENNEIYVGIIRGSVPWNGPEVLLDEEEICIISKYPYDIKKLPSLPRISYYTSPTLDDTIDKWWNENFYVPPNVTMNLDNIETSLKLVLEGLGYAIVPSIGLDDIGKKLYIQPITDKKGKPITRETRLIFNENSLKFPIIKTFIKFIKDYFGKEQTRLSV